MNHIGIDLGGRKSQVCIRAGSGEIVSEFTAATAALEEILSSQSAGRVILETCAEAFEVANWAREVGHEVRVVPATAVRALGVGARGIKTDRRDARLISEASCKMDLGSVHIPSATSRELKSLLTQRDVLISARTQLVNSVRGTLRTQVLQVRKGNTENFPNRVRELLVHSEHGLPQYIERTLLAIEALNEQIKAADKELDQVTKAHPQCSLLRRTPGVGPVTAGRFVSTVDDVSRFRDAHALQSYFGLTPGERSSSTRIRRTGLTKAGARHVRAALTQASWSIWRTQGGSPLAQWADAIARRRGKQVAVMAVARKLAGILFAILRDNQPYDPTKAAQIAVTT